MNVVQPDNGTLLVIHAAMWMNLETVTLSDRSESQKHMCRMIPFIGNVQNRQIYSNRKQISGCLGPERRGISTHQYRVSLRSDKMV